MDYEVFLISRVKVEWTRTRDNRAAVTAGLVHTADVITAAAAIMIVVLAASLITNVVEVKQMGFALAVAVAVDATLIRIVVVPALMRLAGRANWWLPTWLDRVLPGEGHSGRVRGIVDDGQEVAAVADSPLDIQQRKGG